jgi:hypothetical protein
VNRLFQLNQDHEVCDNRAEHAREEIQRDREELCAGNRQRFLALLTDDLNESFCLLRAIVPMIHDIKNIIIQGHEDELWRIFFRIILSNILRMAPKI